MIVLAHWAVVSERLQSAVGVSTAKTPLGVSIVIRLAAIVPVWPNEPLAFLIVTSPPRFSTAWARNTAGPYSEPATPDA